MFWGGLICLLYLVTSYHKDTRDILKEDFFKRDSLKKDTYFFGYRYNNKCLFFCQEDQIVKRPLQICQIWNLSNFKFVKFRTCHFLLTNNCQRELFGSFLSIRGWLEKSGQILALPNTLIFFTDDTTIFFKNNGPDFKDNLI